MTADELHAAPTFFEVEPAMRRDAVISPCGGYRYQLSRTWSQAGPSAVFVMLNPSTADATADDPTIRRCIGFARSWGCGGLVVVNLYAWRATDPAELRQAKDPIGPENDSHLAAVSAYAAQQDAPLVAAWGAHAREERIARAVALTGMHRLTALALTKSGQPAHPLYLRAGLAPAPWKFRDR